DGRLLVRRSESPRPAGPGGGDIRRPRRWLWTASSRSGQSRSVIPAYAGCVRPHWLPRERGDAILLQPDGRAVVFTDLGPGPGAHAAVHIFTRDVGGLPPGPRPQLTHLPAVPDRPVGTIGLFPGTSVPFFLPDGRIAFQSFGNLDGTNPEGNLVE